MAALDDFLAATKAKESGGNYTVVNKDSGAGGAYQYMPGTWANYKGYARAELAPPAIQDEKARIDAQNLFNRFGNWRDVAIAWYAGPGAVAKASGRTAAQGEYPSINAYADDITRRMGSPTRVQAASVSTTGSQVTAEPAQKNLTPQQLDERITTLALTQHGGVLAPFVNDPEIRALLGRYVKGEIDEATLQGLFMQTKMWTTTADATRKWQALESSDPATAQSRVAQQTANISAMAEQQGVQFDPGRAEFLARESLRQGWNPQQIEDAVQADFRYSETLLAGKAAEYRDRVQQLAAAYNVPLPPDALGNYVSRMVQGGLDEGSLTTLFQNYAKSYGTHIADAIGRGLTFEDVAGPVRNQISDALGIAPASINFQDPKWLRFISSPDPKTGEKRMMDFWEVQKTLRSDPGYGYWQTDNGKRTGYQMVLSLAQSLGKVAR